MEYLHVYAETAAIGDTAFNLCRFNAAMHATNSYKVIVHTRKDFAANNRVLQSNPNVIEIYKKTNFIENVVFDEENYLGKEYFHCLSHNNILNWIDLQEYIPEKKSKKTILFQPISLKFKPKEHINDYIPVWKRCIDCLLRKNYEIIMVGGLDDPLDLCIESKHFNRINNKCGKWTILQSIAYLLYEADAVLSCDSWAGIWGIAARKPTAISWGYRMENNIDWWATNFLGNRDVYKYGWSSQKDYCDALLADFLSKL